MSFKCDPVMDAPISEVMVKFARQGVMRSLASQLLSVAVALLIASGLMLWFNLIDLRNDFEANRAASRTVERLDDVEKYLLGVDLTVRGYALTGDRVFLGYHDLEMKKLIAAFAPVSEPASGVPAHRPYLERLRTAMRVRLDTLAQLLNTAQSNPQAFRLAIVDPSVRSTMREARAAISSLRQMELKRRDTLATEAQDRAKRNTLLAGAVLALAFVFGVIGLSCALFSGRGTTQSNPSQSRGSRIN